MQATDQPGIRMLARLFAIALLLLTAPLAAAAPPPSPSFLPDGADRWVYAELALAQPDLTSLVLSGDLYIHRYDIDSDVYDADEMGAAYNGFNRYGKATGDAFIADMETEVRAAVARTLGDSFADATIGDVTATVDRTTLGASSGNSLDPPVRIAVGATVERTREAVGLGDLSDAGVAAAFASGARVRADFSLAAEQGYRIVYAIGAPASPADLLFLAEGASSPAATLTLEVDNSVGAQAVRDASADIVQSGVTPPDAEDIRSTIDVTMGDPRAGETGLPMRVLVDSQIRALDVAERFPGALPEKVSLDFVNADGVRALRSSGVLKDEDVSSANDALLQQVRADIQRAFGGSPTVTGGLAASDMVPQTVATPYTDERPLTFNAFSNATYAAGGVSADDIDLAMRIGGTATVELDLFAANGRETTFTIHPPTIGVFTETEGGSVAANGRTATFTVPAGATAHETSVALRGSDVPAFTAEDAEISITVDLQDLDVSTGKALGGDLGNLVVELTVLGNLNVIAVPEDLKSSLPANLDLSYISSDAIRLLVDKGRISPANLTKLEDSLRTTVTEKLGAALGGDIPVQGGFDSASLQVNLVQTPISADEPIVFQATAKFLKPMSGGDIQPQAAIALYTTELPLSLPKLEGRETVYTIIAPKGLALTGSSDGEISQAPDGRDQLTVRPQSESDAITLSLAVTPGFVFAKFWPLVLLAVVLLVLIIGTPIALVVRARGKKMKAAAPPKK